MEQRRLTHWQAYIIVVLVWMGLFLPALGGLELKGEEGRRILPGRTMMKTGQWILPMVGGEDYYNKPPMINWLIAGSFYLTGMQTEFTARLPSVVFMFLTVTILFWMPSRWLGLRGRFLVALIFMTNIGMVEKGRLIEIECVYVCLTGIAIFWWMNEWIRGGPRWSLWLVPAAALTIAMLIKGPLMMVVVYTMIFSVCTYTKQWKRLLAWEHLAALVVIFGVFLWWFFAAQALTDSEAMTKKMTGQMMSRLSVEHYGFSDWISNFWRAPKNFLPWLIILPAVWIPRFTRWIPQEDMPLFKACRLAMWVSFLLINLMPGTQPRYSMPVLPLTSLVLGWGLMYYRGFEVTDRIWKSILLGLFGFVSAVGVFLLVYITDKPQAWLVVIITLLTCGAVFVYRDYFRNVERLALLQSILTVLVVFQFAVFYVTYRERSVKFRPAGYAVNTIVPEDEPVHVYQPGFEPFLFYVNEPLRYVLSPEEIGPEVDYLIAEDKYFEELEASDNFTSRHPKYIYEFSDQLKRKYRHGQYLKGGYFLIRLNGDKRTGLASPGDRPGEKND